MTAATPVVPGAIALTDMVGFTEYTALRGDAEALAMLAVQERLVQDALPRNARVVKELGDGLLIWFAGAAEAIETCLDLQASFDSESQRGDVPLWVRIGLHWGTPAERRGNLIGHDVNVASRIVNVAGPGEVVVSGAARSAAAVGLTGVTFEELGPVMLKGIPEAVPLFRATRISAPGWTTRLADQAHWRLF